MYLNERKKKKKSRIFSGGITLQLKRIEIEARTIVRRDILIESYIHNTCI